MKVVMRGSVTGVVADVLQCRRISSSIVEWSTIEPCEYPRCESARPCKSAHGKALGRSAPGREKWWASVRRGIQLPLSLSSWSPGRLFAPSANLSVSPTLGYSPAVSPLVPLGWRAAVCPPFSLQRTTRSMCVWMNERRDMGMHACAWSPTRRTHVRRVSAYTGCPRTIRVILSIFRSFLFYLANVRSKIAKWKSLERISTLCYKIPS